MPADQFPKFPVFPGDGALAWLRFARAYTEMSTAAAEVIMHRTMKMAQGGMAAPEMLGMVLEKATAFAEASEKAAVAAVSGRPGADRLRGIAPLLAQNALERAQVPQLTRRRRGSSLRAAPQRKAIRP